MKPTVCGGFSADLRQHYNGCTKVDGKKIVLRDLYRSGVGQVGVTNFAVINGKLEEKFGKLRPVINWMWPIRTPCGVRLNVGFSMQIDEVISPCRTSVQS